ncbi:unnamed protein product [Ixodes pacificus]
MNANDTLTEAQKKLIEENRRKALEKRAERLKASASQAATAAPSKNYVHAPSQTATTYNGQTSKTSTFYHQGQNKPQWGTQNSPQSWGQSRAGPCQQDGTFKADATSSTPAKIVNGSCILVSPTRFVVDVPYHQQMIEIFKTISSRNYDAVQKRWSFALSSHNELVQKLKPLRPNVLVAEIPSHVLKVFEAAPTEEYEVSLSGIDCKLEQALLPFQKEGVCTAIRRNGRLLIADDMGLGKTIQSIAVACYFREEWPVLVVAPSSVRFTWKEAFLHWMPSLRDDQVTVLVTGSDKVDKDHQVVITSYDLLSRKVDDIRGKFQVVILDESHFIKSHKAARTKACQKVIAKAKRVLLLTGTPALSRPIELYTQICAVRPKCFPNIQEYGIRYCNGKVTQWGWDYSGSSNMQELQLLLEKSIMIRRLKSDVLSQLPAKQRQVVVLDPLTIKTTDKVLQHMAKEMQNESIQGMQRRGVLLTYFRETGLHKCKAICKYLEDLLESDQKFLCFAHHQVVIDAVCELLDKKSCSHIRIDGKTSPELRKMLCDKFQYNDMCKVAVLSITAANAGITLSSASLVVFAELFWNPGILTQAEDRVHRIGQQNCVMVQYLVAKGTADDYIWPLVRNKLDTLSKAGLSKDNFYDVDLKTCADSKQKTLDDWFGLEDDESWMDLLEQDDKECVAKSDDECGAVKKPKVG